MHIERSYVLALSPNLSGCVQVGAENESSRSLPSAKAVAQHLSLTRTHLNSLLAELVFLS